MSTHTSIPGRAGRRLVSLCAFIFASALATAGARPPVSAVQATGTTPDEQLLDVGIDVFGWHPKAEKPVAIADAQILEDLRKAEARYLPILLRNTLEATGQWGAVRVVPAGLSVTDLRIEGELFDASGRRLELRLRVSDSTGEQWLERDYYWRADDADYPKGAAVAEYPFRSLLNQIANDLVKARDRRRALKLEQIRHTTDLRFAVQLAPEAFDDHLEARGKGRFEVVRLPAEGDPMMARARRIRERDQAVVDTLNEHYTDFQERMRGPYGEWLAQSFQEIKAYDDLRRKSIWKKIIGGALIIGAVVADERSDGYGSDLGSQVAVIVGAAAIESGIKDGREKKIHAATLGELATQFEAGVAPLVVEIEGQTIELKGTAEEQYAQWRQMLRQIFHTEAGIAEDPNAVFSPAPSVPAPSPED